MTDTRALARRLLENAKTIAVLGAHPTSWRPACYVPEYLQKQGYRVLPVNPRFAGKEMFGEPVVATLAELDEAVDFVDVFRRPEWLPDHVEDILAMTPRPPAVWLQAGIVNDEFAAALEAEGIEVVQDRCTLADHRSMGIGPIKR
jgi:predicted CoA-binding protein